MGFRALHPVRYSPRPPLRARGRSSADGQGTEEEIKRLDDGGRGVHGGSVYCFPTALRTCRQNACTETSTPIPVFLLDASLRVLRVLRGAIFSTPPHRVRPRAPH